MLFRLVLAAFCGLRRSECVRITPDAILDEKDEVFVSASIAKTGKQRFVPLPTAAKAWLALAKYEPPPDEIASQKTVIAQRRGTDFPDGQNQENHAPMPEPAVFGLLYESVFRKSRHGTIIFRSHGQNHVLLQMAGPPGKDGTLPVFPVANQ